MDLCVLTTYSKNLLRGVFFSHAFDIPLAKIDGFFFFFLLTNIQRARFVEHIDTFTFSLKNMYGV